MPRPVVKKVYRKKILWLRGRRWRHVTTFFPSLNRTDPKEAREDREPHDIRYDDVRARALHIHAPCGTFVSYDLVV